MELNEIKDIAIIAKPFVDPLISTLIAPKLERLKAWLKKEQLNNDVADNFFENKFEEFLYRTYKNCSTINVLVFPNQQIEIKNIYHPLSIRSSKDHSKYTIDTFKKEYIEPHKNILISDNAGMGKSTLMKWISLSLIEQSISIPILIELKKIKADHKLLDEIYDQINPIDKSFDKELIIRFLELGSFTILLDGFDEIEYDQRETVIADIKELVTKADKNWFILTSRPDPELTSFGEFQLFNIEPLSKNEAFALIDKYDQINNNHLSDKLKENIEEKIQHVQEFLSNPFLVSLLYKTYTYNKDIPSKKSTFYEEVYYALYKHHDLSKDGFKRNKKSGLDIHDFRLVLRMLAFDTAKQVKVEYTDVQLIDFLKSVNAKLSEVNFKELSYVEDLELNVPLFVRDGTLIKWAHKSVQDYFAAEFISSHEKKSDILNRIYSAKKGSYLQILDFVAELEPQVFKETIIYQLLKKYVRYCEESYVKIDVSSKLKRKRQAISFGVLYGIQQSTSGDNWLSKYQHGERNVGEFSINMIFYSQNDDIPVIEVFGTSFNQEIINIIGNKGYDFVRKIERTDELVHIPAELVKLEMNFVDDEEDNLLNKHETFDLVSNKMISTSFNSRTSSNLYLLDYEKCVEELSNIEAQIKLSEDDDILAGI